MYLSFLKIKKTIEIKGSERSLFISFRGLSCKAKPRKDHSSFLRSRKEEYKKTLFFQKQKEIIKKKIPFLHSFSV
jgi:hypothetical protein